MRKFSTIQTLLVLLFFGSVSNLQAAISWMGNQETGLTATYTHNNTTDALTKTYTVQVFETGVTDAPGEGTAIDCYLVYHYNHGITGTYSFDGPDTEVPMSYGEDVGGANDKYYVVWSFPPRVAAKIEVYFKCVNGASTWYQDGTNAGGQATHTNSAPNFVWDLGITSPDVTKCNFDGGWTHPLYTFHSEFGANTDWFTTNVGLAEPTIQGNSNYAQATVKAVNTNSNFIWQKDFKYDSGIRRWRNASFAKNTCAEATNVNTESDSQSTVSGGITVDNYYTLRFRRTLTNGDQGDLNAVRAFSLMETTTPPIRITSMEAAGARISSEDIDDDVDARGELVDRSQQCSPGNAIKLYDGNLYRPTIKMNQGVSVTGTYSGDLGNQHVYVRYIRQDASNDKITKCTAGSGNFSCTIPQADLVAGSQWNYYAFVAPIDFTSTGAGAVNTSTNAVTDGNCLDLLSLDWWNYQIAEATVAAKRGNVNLAEKFRRTPNRNFEFQVSSILPISLTSLTATVTANRADLQWRTATETNNAGFYVEQLQNDGQWVVLDYVQGQGNSTTEYQYATTVSNLKYGNNTFRLRQVDKDGLETISNEITVLVELPGTALLSSAYPNPFSHTATIEFAVAATQNVKVEVFNVLGQRVQTLFDGTLEGNTVTSAKLDATGLSNGTYVVRMTGANFVKTENVVLVK